MRTSWMSGIGALAILVAFGPTGGSAQQSADELAQEAANPIADLISLPLQLNNDFGLGEYDRVRNVLNVQPVIPLFGGKLVTRTIIPFVWLPDTGSESGSYASGLSDIMFTAFYVPPGGGLMWGVGPVLEFPTGGSKRGSEKWSVGASGVLLKTVGPWTVGGLVNNVWSVAGEESRNDINKGLFQYFIVRQMGNGWYLNSAPLITVNWEAESGQQWVVPFGAGGGKLFFAGKLPINVQSQAYFNAVKPDIGPDWQLRVQVQLLFPAPGG